MMARLLPLLLLASWTLTLVRGDADLGLCCLCNQCQPPISGRENMFVDGVGTTCIDLMLEMADPSNSIRQGNGQCNFLKNRSSNRCCNRNFNPSPIAQAATQSPRERYPPGNNPKCELCHEGGRPGRPNTVTSILGISGTPRCEDLYWMGQVGQITAQLCNPMQDFMDVPCGCYDRNPAPAGWAGRPGGPNPSPSPGNGGTNGGGNQGAGSPSGPTIPGVPDKKVAPPADKDSTKLSSGRVRGAGRRTKRRVLKGRVEETAEQE